MKNVFVLTSLFFLFQFFLPAQSVWYFGNGAGLKFSNNHAQPIFDGKLFTLEGCATATDDSGNLLFYTDGITVWNKKQEIMSNGANLNGSKSSTQSALIVKKPTSKSIFYLFTTDEKAGSKGFCYSVIDISRQGGVVLEKNIRLLESCTEKLTVTLNNNHTGYWIVVHAWNSNNFFSYPLTSQGIGSPVKSAVGTIHNETGASENKEAIGSICFSPNGRLLASAICYRTNNNLELFDFDNSTGKISNVLSLTLLGSPYGLAFSEDNSKLYISFLKGKTGITQLNIIEKVFSEVARANNDNSFGSLNLAPDGKIYVARPGRQIAVIRFPDYSFPDCNYESNAIDLSPRSSNFGLPAIFYNLEDSNNIKDVSGGIFLLEDRCSQIIEKPFSRKNQLTVADISVCENEYYLSAKNFGATYAWSTLETAQQIVARKSGMYKVEIAKEGCLITDSVRLRFRKDNAVFTYLPSFNPGAEFLNGEFYYEIDDVKSFVLRVFDKKGKNVIFETSNFHKKWSGKISNGKIVEEGEYRWVVKYTPNCPKNTKEIVLEGKVVVGREKK